MNNISLITTSGSVVRDRNECQKYRVPDIGCQGRYSEEVTLKWERRVNRSWSGMCECMCVGTGNIQAPCTPNILS